jgi:antitoxin (DNA-binding transcriptional repressor) of toxin-antitoxin stability system
MNASILDLRKNMKSVLSAIERNEQVTLTYRGNKKAVIISCNDKRERIPASEHPAFSMWANHSGLEDVNGYVRKIRKGRTHAV